VTNLDTNSQNNNTYCWNIHILSQIVDDTKNSTIHDDCDISGSRY
jgi:hypothetical protein